MAVARGKAVHVLRIVPVALKALVEERLVGLEMLRVGGVDDFDLAERILDPVSGELRTHVVLAADDHRLAHACAIHRHRGAQHPAVVAFGEDHPRLLRPREC